MEHRLAERLVCPRDRASLASSGGELACEAGHRYPVVDGIPVLLRDDVEPTLAVFTETLAAARRPSGERSAPPPGPAGGIDPYVQRMVAHTCGRLYQSAVGRLSRYPIPEIALPPTSGARLLDIGCGWGRWSISAARKGYSVVGIDPSLEAAGAATRVSRQLGVEATFVVADGRHLPFPDASFDAVFSYGVLQHFSKPDVRRTLAEVARTLRPGGTCVIGMPNSFGPLTILRRLQTLVRPPEGFDVRYWTPRELVAAFTESIGPTTLDPDSYFFLTGQASDRAYRLLVSLSELVRRASGAVPPLTYLADTLTVRSLKPTT
jgi:2-polyprenyl-3-methyl-5-hydroxy-6-metoxy-1,4-benzoquinol methylase/uncharacterized protein YbaR (Trm112 family)